MSKRTFPLVHVLYGLLLIAGLVLLGLGIALAAGTNNFLLLAAGAVETLTIAALWPIAVGIGESRYAANSQRLELQALLDDRLQQVSVMLNLISEQQLLSDRAKAVAFREKDRDALRRAIQEEIAKGDYEAANALADDIEESFGYRQEADRFRTLVRSRRDDVVRRQISDALGVIDRHTRSERWADAQREADRLAMLYPDHPTVRELPAEIENRRQAHKKRLLESWQDAVARHDTDGSIEILKQLDVYLMPSEAEGLQETARGVFKEKLSSLGQQFTTAVKEHRFPEAIRLAETIMTDFPNTKMSQEVRNMIDTLRQRASEPDQISA